MIDHPQDIVFLVSLSLKERIDCDKNFQYWIEIFGHPNKILVDNGREFYNTEFQTI